MPLRSTPALIQLSFARELRDSGMTGYSAITVLIVPQKSESSLQSVGSKTNHEYCVLSFLLWHGALAPLEVTKMRHNDKSSIFTLSSHLVFS